MKVNYVCCHMLSLEHFMRFDERSPYEKNFIYAYQAVPTLRVSYITQDIYVCSFLLCDHLPRKNIESFTPTYSYRFEMAYEELSSVCMCAPVSPAERTAANRLGSALAVSLRVFSLSSPHA